MQSDIEKAIELFDLLIKEEPRSVRSHYFRGLAYLGKSETRIAKASLGKAAELDPRSVEVKLLLAETYIRERDFVLAQKECEEILEILPVTKMR